MSWLQVVVLAVLQGLTEFLPVSSSGHLAIASQLFFDDDAGASFTAVTQLGTELAVLVYFAGDIRRILIAWFGGLRDSARRTSDYWLGWWVIIGTIPICVLGLLFKDQIRGGVRNLWIVAAALALHGLFDIVHGGVVRNPGMPAWWPAFCSSYDLAAAAWLAWRIRSTAGEEVAPRYRATPVRNGPWPKRPST